LSKDDNQKENVVDYKNIFKSMDNKFKWKLESSGRYVENVLYSYAIKNDDSPELPLHSFIIDLKDSIIKKIFTNPELEEMANTNIKTDPVVDKVFVDELNRFSEITTIQGFRVALNKLSTKCLETSNKDDHFSLDTLHYIINTLIRQYERHPNPFTVDHHEGWYVVNLWGPVVDRMFDDLEHIDVIRGDASSIASSERKNLNRNFTKRKKVGRKIDGLIRNTDGLEYGGMEAGRYYEGEKGTKWLKESNLKLPKLSRDMLVQLDHEKKTVLEELEIVGFVHGGCSLMLIFVDIPKGYICRLTRSIVYEIPTKIKSFYKALELISAVWTAKLKVQRTISIVEQPKLKYR
ncbi:12781_t:CDS:2, partial [Entrophospora sp. SA101]